MYLLYKRILALANNKQIQHVLKRTTAPLPPPLVHSSSRCSLLSACSSSIRQYDTFLLASLKGWVKVGLQFCALVVVAVASVVSDDEDMAKASDEGGPLSAS